MTVIFFFGLTLSPEQMLLFWILIFLHLFMYFPNKMPSQLPPFTHVFLFFEVHARTSPGFFHLLSTLHSDSNVVCKLWSTQSLIHHIFYSGTVWGKERTEKYFPKVIAHSSQWITWDYPRPTQKVHAKKKQVTSSARKKGTSMLK